ncbi:hypothetical protein H5410_027457 [Solanum commersonii]|uniref:Uncharacterized protein n=1 Tax=Solanum commersonii TaxID=4109 RepID=A0A9J5Z1B5_SOLCO|nr:hypothetical protein H5410_027457 [Solanum commersonii]
MEQTSDTMDKQEAKIVKLENDLQNWSIPEEPYKKIYHLGNFSYLTRRNIKTCESTIAINNSLEIIRLLKDNDINCYKSDYNYLHIGLVQVAVKPLFRKGLDIPVCVILRDGRFLNFDDSMLGVLQSNLADGPVYFYCYPNFSVDINDPNVMDSLTLNVKTKNLNSKINTREIAIIYRVYYRLMKTHLAPKARHTNIRGETMLMEANHEHSSIFVPRTLQWKDILSSNDWRFKNIAQPFASHSERSQIERVIQFPDRSIELKFSDNPSSWSPSISCPSRPVPRPPSSSKTQEEVDDDDISVADNSKGKVIGVDFSGNIPKVFYQDIPGSPTASEMEPPKEKPSWLGMLKVNKVFERNPNVLQEQWTHPDNQVKRKWYVSSYTLKQRESFRDLWMKDMRRIGCEIEFFKWFEMIGRIENCTESLKVIINKWYTASNKVVKSITLPLEGINIPIAGTVTKASPFKEKSDKTCGLLTSNNYSNQILDIISRQIEDTKPSLNGRPTLASTSSNHNIETYPGFKIPKFSKKKFPKLFDTFEVTGSIIEKINARLNNFNISKKEDKTSNKVTILQEEPNPKSQEKSNLLQKLASSRFHNMKNYHNKPSFPDLQYEENAFLSTSSHEGRSITKWNIDGLAEHQVYNKLHEMGVAITAYKMRGLADRDAANMIIAGFTGMLKHWWDNYYTDEIKHLIINATTTETVVKTEGNTQTTSNVTREDACATLLYHIAKHFIGEPKLFQDRSLQILSNLSCPNLDNFIHYKHAFLSKVMIRPYCNLDFWKECFISGLPPLFADKVRTKIQDRNNGNIPYGNLTYGDLVSTINVVVLELCTDIKLKHQLKKEQPSSRKKLGSFCRDFGTSDEYSDDEDIDLDYDSDSRNRFLLELKNLLLNTDKPKTRLIIEPFNIKQIMNRSESHSEPSILDLRHEVSSLKEEIRNIKSRLCIVETDMLTNQVPKRTALQDLESNQSSSHEDLDDNIGIDLPNINNDNLVETFVTNIGNDTSTSAAPGVTVISSIRPQSHHIPVKIVVSKHIVINKIALLDSSADRNCIVKGIVPTKYLQKSTSKLYSAIGELLKINYKLSKAHICNNGICLTNDFVITEDINEDIILGIPFITQIKPYFTDLDGITTTIIGKDLHFPFVKTFSQDESNFVRENTVFRINNLSQQITFLKDEIRVKKIEQILKTPEIVTKTSNLQEKFEKEICSDFPNAFWERKNHILDLPYIEGFNEQAISTKARPIQMNHEMMEFCRKRD